MAPRWCMQGRCVTWVLLNTSRDATGNCPLTSDSLTWTRYLVQSAVSTGVQRHPPFTASTFSVPRCLRRFLVLTIFFSFFFYFEGDYVMSHAGHDDVASAGLNVQCPRQVCVHSLTVSTVSAPLLLISQVWLGRGGLMVCPSHGRCLYGCFQQWWSFSIEERHHLVLVIPLTLLMPHKSKCFRTILFNRGTCTNWNFRQMLFCMTRIF